MEIVDLELEGDDLIENFQYPGFSFYFFVVLCVIVMCVRVSCSILGSC